MTTPPYPQNHARLGGLLYLVIIAAGIFGELFVRGSMVASGDAAATAAHIAATPGLWRTGIAVDLLMHVCDVFVMWVIYLLLRPTSARLALLVLLLNLIQTAVLVANKLLLLVPLFLSEGHPAYLAGLDAPQLQALGYLAIRIHEYGFGVGLVFFGAVCLVEGYLIRRSGYLPRLIGTAMQLAGACYVVNSTLLLLMPHLQGQLFPFLMLPCLVAELSFALWLLVRGVDVQAFHKALARA
ncbi:DUF4386 domain-containing protein [Cognatilysobacter lacus]|nr:DUF4386 domain-containing protein [Lysobacter lacus]